MSPRALLPHPLSPAFQMPPLDQPVCLPQTLPSPVKCEVQALGLAFPTVAVVPAAKAFLKTGRSGTLEPEVKDKRVRKNGLQAGVRNQGNRALNVIKGLYLEALKQNTQAWEKRLCQVSAMAMGETANP